MERYEAEHGVVIPAAVREFYSVGGDKLIGARAEEEIVELDEFLQNFARSLADPSPEGPRFVCLTMPLHNHSYQFDLVLEESDDPWVEPSMPVDLPGPFSTFLLSWAWDRTTTRTLNVTTGNSSLAGSAVRFGPPHLDFLLSEFEGPPNVRSGPVDPGIFPFGSFRPGQRVEVVSIGDPACRCARRSTGFLPRPRKRSSTFLPSSGPAVAGSSESTFSLGRAMTLPAAPA
jgi:hypothetical protein